MNAVTPVPFTTPDGVERSLRFTLGALRRIHERFGGDLIQALKVGGDGALPEILYALMYDEDGKPPADLTLARLQESFPVEAVGECMAAVLSAASQGKASKKDLEALIARNLPTQLGVLIGSISGASQPDQSASATETSGGDTSNAKSSPESNGSANSSEEKTTEQA